jgi:hypothetical protein
LLAHDPPVADTLDTLSASARVVTTISRISSWLGNTDWAACEAGVYVLTVQFGEDRTTVKVTHTNHKQAHDPTSIVRQHGVAALHGGSQVLSGEASRPAQRTRTPRWGNRGTHVNTVTNHSCESKGRGKSRPRDCTAGFATIEYPRRRRKGGWRYAVVQGGILAATTVCSSPRR